MPGSQFIGMNEELDLWNTKMTNNRFLYPGTYHVEIDAPVDK